MWAPGSAHPLHISMMIAERQSSHGPSTNPFTFPKRHALTTLASFPHVRLSPFCYHRCFVVRSACYQHAPSLAAILHSISRAILFAWSSQLRSLSLLNAPNIPPVLRITCLHHAHYATRPYRSASTFHTFMFRVSLFSLPLPTNPKDA